MSLPWVKLGPVSILASGNQSKGWKHWSNRVNRASFGLKQVLGCASEAARMPRNRIQRITIVFREVELLGVAPSDGRPVLFFFLNW